MSLLPEDNLSAALYRLRVLGEQVDAVAAETRWHARSAEEFRHAAFRLQSRIAETLGQIETFITELPRLRARLAAEREQAGHDDGRD